MKPALNEGFAEIKDNIFSHSAGAPVQLEYGAAYLLAGGGDGLGFYLCSDGTLAMNKAFLPSSVGVGAPRNMVLRNQTSTDILKVECHASLNDVVYDLCGRRVENPKKRYLHSWWKEAGCKIIVAMKKVYRQPLAAFVEIAVCRVIAVYGGARGSGSSIGSGTVDSGVEWVVRREMIGRILGMAYRHL